jgi:hypothetical protein
MEQGLLTELIQLAICAAIVGFIYWISSGHSPRD